MKWLKNIFVYIVLNIYFLLDKNKHVEYCPKCRNASMWVAWSVHHCDLCGYHNDTEDIPLKGRIKK